MADHPNPYSNLTFASNVDWWDVKPDLLVKLNGEAKANGQTVHIFSGYRNKAYNAKVGGASNSNHTRGEAVDATINGKPIGEVWTQQQFQNLGLRSGNQPNFYKGKPDPEHVDMGAPGGGSDGSAPPVDTGGGAPVDTGTTASNMVDDSLAAESNTQGANVLHGNQAAPPGSGLLDPVQRGQQETWQLLSQLPGASSDTTRFAQLAGLGDPNAGA